MSVVVRRAVAEDAAMLARLAAVTFPLACPPHTTDEAKASFIAEHLSHANFVAYLADPSRDILLADLVNEEAPSAAIDDAVSDDAATSAASASDDARTSDFPAASAEAAATAEAVGYTMLVFSEPSDSDVASALTVRPTIELSKFYVLAGLHGQGVSTALMTATLDAARKRGASGVWLGVNEENGRANRFYEKNGFTRVGTKRFLVGETYEDDYVRELVL